MYKTETPRVQLRYVTHASRVKTTRLRLPDETRSVGDTWPRFFEENATQPTIGLWGRDAWKRGNQIA